MQVPTPMIALSPSLSASNSMPAIALGVLIVTSMLGTPPSKRAVAMSGNCSFDLARITATTPASDICWINCCLLRGIGAKFVAETKNKRHFHAGFDKLLAAFLRELEADMRSIETLEARVLLAGQRWRRSSLKGRLLLSIRW
jgi:hypothetical protein